MSDCGPDCDCPDAKKRRLCPQACGKPWPACGCPTAEEKFRESRRSFGVPAPRALSGSSMLTMMTRLAEKKPRYDL